MAMDYRTALLDQLDPTLQKKQGAAGLNLGEMGEPGGYAGSAPPLAPPPPSAPLPASPLADAPGLAAPVPKKPFQSGNASVSGYLGDAMRNFAPTIQGIRDEAGRKSALKNYLTEIAPEVQARGGSLTDIRDSDKARVDGRVIDFFGDIEGSATPQYLDVTDEATRAPQGISPILGGDAMNNIQSALGKFGQAPDFIQQLLAKLQQGGA